MLPNDAHAVPFQCRSVPMDPTAHTSLGPVPHTPNRSWLVPLVEGAQALPFQCSMLPKWPTVHTSLGPLPHTPVRTFAGELVSDHALPSQCRIVSTPTAHTSFGPLLQ